MSDDIPFEIQVEIIKRLPFKSLIQFRLVSKLWNSFIGSSEIIVEYGLHHTQQQSLLARYIDPVDYKETCVTIVDDDTFTHQKFAPTVPVLTKLLRDSKVIDCSHGLLCVQGSYRDPWHYRYQYRSEMAVLWNPLIRRSVGVVLPYGSDSSDCVIGFGVCPLTCDPMIIKIKHVNMAFEWREGLSIPWKVEVFKLSVGSWGKITSSLPRQTINVQSSQIVINRFIYWAACERIRGTDGEFRTISMVVSFDMTTQEFNVIEFPDKLSHRFYMNVSKLWESLAVLEYISYHVNEVCVVWMMDDGVTNSFKKLFTIYTPNPMSKAVVGFSKSGEPIMEGYYDHENFATLEVYDPSSERITSLGIYGEANEEGSIFVSTYMETLLLLDQPHCHIYDDTY